MILKRLTEITDVDTANRIRAMVAGELDPRDVSEQCDRWVRQCYHEPSYEEQVMSAADELLGTCGIEGFCTEDGRHGVSYCNTGDQYALTLVLRRGRFYVGCQPTSV